jgi:hypothetical protein
VTLAQVDGDWGNVLRVFDPERRPHPQQRGACGERSAFTVLDPGPPASTAPSSGDGRRRGFRLAETGKCCHGEQGEAF